MNTVDKLIDNENGKELILDKGNDRFFKAFELVKNGTENIFITGKAGTGKTTFLKYVKNNIKKNIAIVNKEITLLWNCGIENRKSAWKHNIKRYDDVNLNSKILGFKKCHGMESLINSMLKIIHTDKKYIINKSNNLMDWQQKYNYEF